MARNKCGVITEYKGPPPPLGVRCIGCDVVLQAGDCVAILPPKGNEVDFWCCNLCTQRLLRGLEKEVFPNGKLKPCSDGGGKSKIG